MLSRELGTHLTGRCLSVELYPFSYKEFILLKNPGLLTENRSNKSIKAECLSFFHDYFHNRGFPEFIKTKNEPVLKKLPENILYRDIMVRNNITNEKEIELLVSYLAGNFARLSSNSQLTEIVGFKNPTTIKKYFGFLADSYLTGRNVLHCKMSKKMACYSSLKLLTGLANAAFVA